MNCPKSEHDHLAKGLECTGVILGNPISNRFSPRRFATNVLRLTGTLTLMASTFVSIASAQPVVTGVVPGSATAGSTIIVSGSSLPQSDLEVLFTNHESGTVEAEIVVRAHDHLQIVVPLDAVTGPVVVRDSGVPVHSEIFEIEPPSSPTKITDIVSSSGPLRHPSDVLMMSDGRILISDTLQHRIVIASFSGEILRVIGSGRPGFQDGGPEVSSFHEPRGLAADSDGTIYVADSRNHSVRVISSAGVVSTLAGGSRPGLVDGPVAEALFHEPVDLGFHNGRLIVIDQGNHAIRSIDMPAGSVSTIEIDKPKGTPPVVRLHSPSGFISLRELGLVISDSGNHSIRGIHPEGDLYTVAGTSKPGFSDGATPQFHTPSGLDLFEGRLILADSQNHAIRSVRMRDGVASTITGNGNPGSGNELMSATLDHPEGLDVFGGVAIADAGNDAVRFLWIQPSVSALYPSAGQPAGGNLVYVFGRGFVPGATTIEIRGRPAEIVEHLSGELVRVRVPSGAPGPSEVRVFTTGGESILSNGYEYFSNVRVQIDSPLGGSSVTGSTLLVRGTVSSSVPLPGVSVNGFPASVDYQAQGTEDDPYPWVVAVTVPEGDVDLTATGVTTLGASHSETVQIHVMAPVHAVALSLSPTAGIEPLVVRARVVSFHDVMPVRYEIDFTGDGTADWTSTTLPKDLQWVYRQPGVYPVSLRVAFEDGTSSSSSAVVAVQDFSFMDESLRVIWNGFLDELGSSAIDAAMYHIADRRDRDRYRTAFEAIRPMVRELSEKLRDIHPMEIGGDYATYLLIRQVGGQEFGFHLFFVRTNDGLWRISHF